MLVNSETSLVETDYRYEAGRNEFTNSMRGALQLFYFTESRDEPLSEVRNH